MDVIENREHWEERYKSVWLKHYEETGETHWKIYERPRNSEAPGTSGINLSQARLVLISTAGGYLKQSQAPFDAEHDLGDYSIRLFSIDTPFEDIAYAHTHYDHTAVNADPQVLVPLLHLKDLVEEGVIGELAPHVISYMGYQPDFTRTVDELAPAVLEVVNEMNATAALLVPS